MSVPAITLHRSNRGEVLAASLAEVLRTPLPSPFDPEWIVVPGKGMSVWLSMELARHQGVWAGGDFLYPRHFVQRVCSCVLGEQGTAAERFARHRLVWSLMELLVGLEDQPQLARLSAAIGEDPSGERCYQLAQQVASVFDQYLTFRPEMLLAWQRAEPLQAHALPTAELWQPALWRALCDRLGGDHLAALHCDLLAALSAGLTEQDATAGAPRFAGLPQRVCVFGLSSLPPMYVRVLAALSRHIEVHLFLLSPCRHYWGDLASRGQRSRALQSGQPVEQLHLDAGHPLLGALGAQGADFLHVLSDELEALEVVEREPSVDLYRAPVVDSVLARLQADILEARPTAESLQPDSSLSVHACHGPMREVEVLHDQLLALLSNGQGVAPQDVLVMMSDVATYAPLVEAVFTRDRDDDCFIPFHIADRSVRHDSPVIDAFWRLLALAGQRLSGAQVLDLLSLEPLRVRFAIAAADVDLIATWLTESGIRWGIDAQHRAAHDQPELHQNTWSFGLQRLMAGYAMAGHGRALFSGTLPYDEIEGEPAELLGKLAAFCDQLFGAVLTLEQARTMADWRTLLGGLLEQLLVHDANTAWQHQRVHLALDELVLRVEEAGLGSEPLGLQVVRDGLEAQLDETHDAHRFLTGGVSFSAMVPMRSIPFEVVCLLGMSDASFPRASRDVDFNLITRGRRQRGDRCRRDDDRYLFLEALLSARRQLIITYTGQSVRDNALLSPSVVVSELLETLGPGAGSSPGSASASPWVLRHRLQPFSPSYFDASDPRLFSYERTSFAGASAICSRAARHTPSLFDSRLPEPEGSAEQPLSLFELERFFRAPIRYLLQQGLGVDLEAARRDPGQLDREPLELDPLQRHQLGDSLLALRLQGSSEQETFEVLRASGQLPLGSLGQCAHADELARVDPIAARVVELSRDERRDDLLFERNLPDGSRLQGTLTDRFGSGLLRYQYARVGAKHLLALWVAHLVRCWLGQDDPTLQEAGPARLIGRPERGDARTALAWSLRPVGQPARELMRLVALYQVGAREPLLLLPASALAYARAWRDQQQKSVSPEAAHAAALAATRRTMSTERERDPYLQRVLGSAEPLASAAEVFGPQLGFVGPSFAELSLAVFLPLLDHMQELV